MNQQTRLFLTRTAYIFFFIQCVPLDPKYYATIFSLPWSKLRYQDIFTLAHYTPRIFGTTPAFADWAAILLIALAGAAAWSYRTRNREWANPENEQRYNARLNYWIRTIVRYRLAIALLAYGFIKIYPLQSPFPSLSNLNTPYGDFTRWKLFSMSLGIVPSYEAFLGGVEIAAALLLLFRKMASVGALIIVFFTGNVLMSNISYEGGEYVYCAYLISLAAFVLAYDLQRLGNLLVFHRPASPNTFHLKLSSLGQRSRLFVKTLVFLFFVVLFGFRTRWGYLHDPYQVPEHPGLSAAAGLYNVSLFRLDHDTLPYSPTDPIRWKNVVFEPWATLSVAGNRPTDIDSANTENVTASNDLDKTYELEGTNGRSYYNYEIDSTTQTLTLRNKNSRDSTDRWQLHYDRPDSSRIILSGLNPRRDSVYVVLDRIDKKYLLKEAAKTGRTKSLKL
jgi:hypothetical protein